MKTLTCDLCGGTDLVMNEGVFTCQTCGTKYSKEDARKMMSYEAGGLASPIDSAQTVATIRPTQPAKITPERKVNGTFIDRTLQCKECGSSFVFTSDEQEFYAERGFTSDPQRCRSCRDARKAAARGPREYHTAVCAGCGGEAKVPFEPNNDRPVYCVNCFEKQKNAPNKQSCLLHIVLLFFTFGIGNIIYFIWAKSKKG